MTFDILSKKFEERYQFLVKSVKYENLEKILEFQKKILKVFT